MTHEELRIKIEELTQRIAELEDDKARLERSRESWQKIAAQHGERIAELEKFVKWVHKEGSDYWRDEAQKLLERDNKAPSP